MSRHFIHLSAHFSPTLRNKYYVASSHDAPISVPTFQGFEAESSKFDSYRNLQENHLGLSLVIELPIQKNLCAIHLSGKN